MKKLKKIVIFIIVAVIAIGLISCGQSGGSGNTKDSGDAGNRSGQNSSNADADQESATTRTVKDALGRTVELPETINRIVVLSNTPRMAVYLGLADKVVGYSGMDADKITPLTAYAYAVKDLWKDVPIVGTDAGGNTDYYPEKIIEVQPDVILCCYTEDVVNALEHQTGIPVVSVSMGNLFEEDYNQSLRTIGEVCGVEKRAEEVIAYISGELEALNKRTAGAAEQGSQGSRPTVLSAAATFKGAHGIEGVRLNDPVLSAVNALNVAEEAAGENAASAVTVDKEQILLWDADYIFCDYGGVKLVKQDIAANPNFYKQLKAYNNGHMYQYPSSTSYYSNLEIPLANCYFVGSVLYPEQFADVDIKTKANEIFKFFLGIDDYMSTLEEYGASYSTIDFGDI